ncbi:hypothetical protein BJY01DRAFT_262198 [Aspergillus pseudoustus]|uniref:RING-type domain-containing protein n=1 Tax=Aspergillus pseudoustus TaxID=1810923 RepID=A0ABR4KB80_9EURO
MDFSLRCNSLSCRVPLQERAIVTTCSHIFCLRCADGLGLSRPTGGERCCPACEATLNNPDDAVTTLLRPTEDYKTSVLSGLDPTTIMDCAGRALTFWTYQTTQEVFYQEYLVKSLTDKYTGLNSQMDKVIHNANTELSAMQARLSDMQTAHDQLRKKNQELVEMYREKCKKFSQITNLYNLVKSRAMRSQMQTAAASQAINSLDLPRNNSVSLATNLFGVSAPPQTPSTYQQRAYPVDPEGVEQLHRHQRSGTGSSKGKQAAADTAAMPPPPSRPITALRRGIHRTRLPGPSRPSTGMSQLPSDSEMTGRFHAERPPIDGFTTGHHHPHSTHRENPKPTSHRPTPEVRSFFNSTITW